MSGELHLILPCCAGTIDINLPVYMDLHSLTECKKAFKLMSRLNLLDAECVSTATRYLSGIIWEDAATAKDKARKNKASKLLSYINTLN